MDILKRIQNDYLFLSPQEKKVADYIMRFSSEIKNMNIKDFSLKTGTSTATVTRFAKKIDCKNFSDMKFQINSLSVPKVQFQTKGISEDVFNYYQMVIKNTQSLIEMNKLETFIRFLLEANQIIIIGLNSSGTTASTFSNRLMRMGLPVVSYVDSIDMVMRGSIASKSDLFVAISNSGTTECVLDSFKQAKKNGSILTSITNFSENPLAALSNLDLYVYSTKFIDNQKFINSQFSMVYLIDVITTLLLGNKELHEKFTQTRETILDNY
ncbi:MurR/RpiR family transcriptional regulator [Vagococcus elongatus]|uniref:RpiR family transcriptional regulator n=1 Tax=Vagococcus elongatus TaxID=180344 RepID=A0A430AZK5_9ENTE|nr:MurR/RpiR family transcriptional regulator [Vagococcus elongatus]RSU13500.1 hypothetical protein CBF29_04400 [Vagococcus elongatus]